MERTSTSDIKQRYLAAKMIGRLEGVVASGAMTEHLEISTRELIREACEAFGMPTISERAA
ncbi:MAG: hypothetical protein J0G95_10980 [Rhizobiales bacterium]|nr:hypothetical protein [Hyphomicrobiales bacterium]